MLPSLSENQIHKLVFDALTALTPKLHCVWFPVPNGVNLPVKVAQVLKGQGKIKAGVSDFVAIGNGGGTGLELKSDTGYQSDDQKLFEAWCKRLGVGYKICRSLDDVLRELIACDFLDAADATSFMR